ncbi:MAG TPA: class I SAM-dependent methyltransferase [Vicinamibacterales bacterium]
MNSPTTESGSDAGVVHLEDARCALCGADDTRFRHHKFGLNVVQCNRCRLVYTNPRLPREALVTRYSEQYFWDEYLPDLEIGRDGYVDVKRFAAHHAPLLHLFQMYHPPPGDLLDVGAAAGLFMKSAEGAGWHVKGLEPMAPAAAFARDRLGLDVVQSTVEEAPFAPGSFDAVVMLETIEHVMDPVGVLSGVHRVLRNRGLLVLTTPNWEAFTRHALGEQWAAISPAEHLYLFSEATLTAVLKKAGFSWVHYHRDFAPRAIETMNADYTHQRGGLRHLAYRAFVRGLGPHVFREIQKRGLADQLVCVARA